ncbi:MAG: DUF1800 family protein, partial [Gemmatimonadaceae bacterium]
YAKSAVRAKVKTPYELVASTYRAMQGIPDSVARSINLTQQLGQQLYGRLTPDGWPDNGGSWMNTGTMLQRINFGTNAAAGRIPGISVARWEPAAKLKGVPLAQQVDAIGFALLHGEMSPDTHNVLMSGSNPLAARAGGTMSGPAPSGPTLAELIGLALSAPEFQRR